MTTAPSPSVKGWCPGALRPMASGDGLVVRVRPRLGAISLAQADALAEAALRFGNGHIDVTRRANLQIRGVDAASLPALSAELDRLGLLDASPDAEAVRNIMVAPLAGIDPACADVRPVVRELARFLATDARLHALPGKFGYAVDGGGLTPIAAVHADIVLAAMSAEGADYLLGLDTSAGPHWVGCVPARHAADAAVAAAHAFAAILAGRQRGRMRDLSAGDLKRVTEAIGACIAGSSNIPPPSGPKHPRIGFIDLGGGRAAIGIGIPFGRLDAEQFRQLARIVGVAGSDELRLSPWRVLYATVRDSTAANAALEAAADAGVMTDASDPLFGIDACPGAPDCTSASLETRQLGRRLSTLLRQAGFRGSLHVSGCAKGCARSAPASLTLVAEDACFNVVRDGTAADAPIGRLTPDDLRSDPLQLLRLTREHSHA